MPDLIFVYQIKPDNIQNIQYKDESGGCFGFTTREVTCPNDKKQIREYPTQEKN